MAVITVDADPLAPLEDHAADPARRCLDPLNGRGAAHGATELFETEHEGVGERLRPSSGVPLAEEVVRRLPEGEKCTPGQTGARCGVSGEGGHRTPGEVAGKATAQEGVVGSQEVAHRGQGLGPQQPHHFAQTGRQLPQARLASDGGQDGPHNRDRRGYELAVGGGLGGARLRDGVDRGLDRAVEADPAAVAVHGDRERVHLLVLEPDVGQVQLVGDRGHVDHVVGHGVHVEAVAGDPLLGSRPSARSVQGLEDENLASGLRQVTGRDQPVVAASHHDHVRHRAAQHVPSRRGCRTPPTAARGTRAGPALRVPAGIQSRSSGATAPNPSGRGLRPVAALVLSRPLRPQLVDLSPQASQLRCAIRRVGPALPGCGIRAGLAATPT